MPQPYGGPPAGPETTALPGRVLVVADDATAGHVIGSYLESAGLAVSVTPDGTRALGAFDPERPGVVVLDVTLPAAPPATAGVPVDPTGVRGVRRGA